MARGDRTEGRRVVEPCVKVRRYEEADAARIARFNERLTAGEIRWHVWGEGPHDGADRVPIATRCFVADSDGEVRGAVWLHEHGFWMNGEERRAGWAKYPVSESLVDPAFGGIPAAMLIKLTREQPLLMALGMGGRSGTFARLLQSMRWTGVDVPFFLRLVHPARVLRRLRSVRSSALRRAVLDLLALTGIGWAGWRALETLRRLRAPRAAAVEVTEEPRFGAWADAVWERTHGAYGLVARRDAAMLNAMFPAELPVVRLRMRRAGEEVGWAVVLLRDLQERPDNPFGALRVGLIADGMGAPADAAAITTAADRHLEAMQADLIFSNQLHPAWIAALEGCGFQSAPSQFAFFSSPKLQAALGDGAGRGMHVNRGDCDGPMFG